MSAAVVPIEVNVRTSSLAEDKGIKEIWQDLKILGKNIFVGDQMLSMLAFGVE